MNEKAARSRMPRTVRVLALGLGAFLTQSATTAFANPQWIKVVDYCWAGNDGGHFSCEQDGRLIATADYSPTWDSRWPTPANSHWGTSYKTELVFDIGSDCSDRAVRMWLVPGAEGNSLYQTSAGCTANVDWWGSWDPAQADFTRYGNNDLPFGDNMEDGDLRDDDSPMNMRLNSIACSCWAYVNVPN